MDNNKIKICVVGLGYVGLPLALAFAEKFQVVGFDIDIKRIKDLKLGYDKTFEVDSKILKNKKLDVLYTAELQDIRRCNIYIITVPTPIDKINKPDLTYLIQASKTVGSVLNQNDIVIFESTVYPGVTENICVPELEQSSGLVFNNDFFCGYSQKELIQEIKNIM